MKGEKIPFLLLFFFNQNEYCYPPKTLVLRGFWLFLKLSPVSPPLSTTDIAQNMVHAMNS